MKEWRKHWKLSSFFNVLIFGLVASLADSGTDFNFAWSLPADCDNATDFCSINDFDLNCLSSPCGIYHYKKVERLTYTFIAFPGLLLIFACLQSLLLGLVNKWTRGEVHRIRGLAKAFAAALEFSLVVGLFFTARWSHIWACQRPHLAPGYDCFLQGMAYTSATLIVGVKCFATFSHGPESCRLVFRAKDAETKFEAAFQLSLLSRIYLSSGIVTSAGLLSVISSVFFIAKTGVQNFLQRHEEKLSEASTLGKICLAASVLPVFLLTTAFKIGAFANNYVWNDQIQVVVILLGLGLPNLLILILKMCNQLKDLKFAHVNNHVISDNLSFHLWPKSFHHGKQIGLAMTVLIFLLHALPGSFLIANPESKNDWIQEWYNIVNNNAFNKWTSDEADRLQLASISFLLIGLVAFVLAVCLILFEDKWVAKIVAKFPNHPKEEGNVEEGSVELEPMNRMSNSPREDQDADKMKKDKIASDLVCKKGNNEAERDLP